MIIGPPPKFHGTRDILRVTPGDQSDPPQALESEYTLKEILIAATIQGAIYSLVKALIDRGSARAFQRWTGEWPGD